MKYCKYGEAVLPLPFETYGCIGSDGRRTLEVLAAHAGACLNDNRALPRFCPL